MKLFENLLIFIFGFLFSKIYDLVIKEFSINRIKEGLEFDVRELINVIPEQLAIFNTAINNLQDKDRFLYDLNITVAISFFENPLSNYRRSEFLSVVTRRKKRNLKIQAFNSLHQNINMIKMAFLDIDNRLKDFEKVTEKNIDKWNNNIQIIQDLYNRYVHQHGGGIVKKNQDEFLYYFANHFIKSTKEFDLQDVYIAHNMFIIPIKDYCTRYPRDIRALEVINVANRCSSVYDLLINNSKQLSDILEDYSKKLIQAKNIIEDIIEKL